MVSNVLSLSNITAGYGEKEVVKNLSLDIKAGETVALVGKNACGKTV